MTSTRSRRDTQRIVENAASRIIDGPYSRDILFFFLYSTAFYVAYRYGMSFSQATASPFWFPDSVLLCALLLSRPQRWWIYLLAPLPIRLLAEVSDGIPDWFLLVTFAIDSAKGLVAAIVLRLLVKHPAKLETVTEFLFFCIVAVVLVPVLSAFGGATALNALGSEYWSAWENWFFGDATAQLVITPALLYWITNAWRTPKIVDFHRWIETGILTVGLILSSYTSATTEGGTSAFAEARFYAPIPFLLWAAVRFGMLGASGAVTVLTFFLVEAAIVGRGPFVGQSPSDVAQALQNFLLLRVAPIYLVAISIDQRRRVERSLQESEQRFSNVANTAPVLIWQSNTDKLCEFVNQSWLAYTGRSLGQEMGNGWTESVHSDDLARCFDIYVKSFDARQRFVIEYRLRRHDGEYRWVLATGVPRYDSNGEFLGYIGSAIDITEHRQVVENSRRLAHAQRLALMGELTAIIAHEVRQPLSAILSNVDAVDMLLRSADPPLDDIRQIMADIRKCDLRADETIDRIRGFLRNREADMQPIDLNLMVADTVRLIDNDAHRRRIAIRCELTPGLPLVVGDQTHLQHVLLNLLVNSLEAMAQNANSLREIVVTTTAHSGGGVRVAVKDHGCGIPVDRLPRLFESFFTTRQDGMGLGLSIARSIVVAHQGHIGAENNADDGATFYFTIPSAQDNNFFAAAAKIAANRTDS